MILFYFSLVYVYAINNIYIANIIYYIIMLKDIIKTQRVSIIKNRAAQFFCILFLIWATISTAFYIFETQMITFRCIIQYLFTLQYFILIISINIKEDKFELWIYRFAVLNALFILLLFFYFLYFSPIILLDDLWAADYIPGWPNTTFIPLLMGLWLSFKNRNSIIGKIIIYLALFLTASRAAILGGLIITFYFMVKKIKYRKRYLAFILVIIISALIGVRYWIEIDPLLVKKMTVTWDRIDICFTTLSFLESRPMLGFGGNTLDQLINNTNIDYFIPVKYWGHTHNMILEILLRYGIIGTILFLGYIVAILVRIKNKDRRFMFLLLLLLSLFQIYVRDFIFLFYMSYLSMENGRCFAKEYSYKDSCLKSNTNQARLLKNKMLSE